MSERELEEEYDSEGYDDEDEEELDLILDQIYDWGIEFRKSSYFDELTEEQKKWSEAVVGGFAERAYSYIGVGPEEWDEDVLDEVCLEIMPAKDTAEDSFFQSIGPVLSAFFGFLASAELLNGADRLAARAGKISRAIAKNARDPRRWGMAKSLAMKALEAGVDLTDERQVNAFFAAYSAHMGWALPAAEPSEPARPAQSKPKVGRNEPCPCGSGKKYKHCCGRGQ